MQRGEIWARSANYEESAETGRARIRLIISGRVQGVGFRFSAYDEAKELALAGFVRNLHSGEVEIVAEGRRDGSRCLWRGHISARRQRT